jgi:hypothetical protein
MTKEMKEFQIKEDMRTLIRAQEIMKDKSRMKAAMAMAKKEREVLSMVMNESKKENKA